MVTRLFIVCCVLMFFQSCYECSDKQVTCPAYSETGMSNWFPYSPNTRLIYSSNSTTDTINIKSIEVTGPYEDRVSARNPYCIADKTWSSLELTSAGFPRFRIQATQFNDTYNPPNSREEVYLSIDREYFSGKGISDTGFVKENFSTQKSQFFPSISVGTNTFSKVQVIEKDTIVNKASRIYKIWIAKHNGLVAYQEYPSKKIWVKQ